MPSPSNERTQRLPALPDQGASFVNYRLTREGEVYVFRPTPMCRAVALSAIVAGVALMLGAVSMLTHGAATALGLFAMGGVCIWVGCWAKLSVEIGARFDTRRRQVELMTGSCWTGRLLPAPDIERVAFDAIGAIELLSKTVSQTDEPDYSNHEINLILRDGRRYNLVSHPDGEQLGREAKTLSSVIGVPVEDMRGA